MDFYRMECFLAAAQTGNMTKAAERMCITQPAMSFQIREMERELSLTLFERQRNGIRLTPAGSLLYEGFLKILEQYHQLLEKARICAYGKIHLNIGYHGFVNWAGLHSFIAAFSVRHPDIEVSILQQQCKELADYIETGSLDVAFLDSTELEHRDGLASLPLFEEKTCFAVPLGHRLARKEKVTIEDLAGETILMNNHPSRCMDTLINNLLRSGIPQEKLRFVPQPDMCLAMSVAGQGLTSLPLSFRQEGIPLRYVEYDSPCCSISFSIGFKKESENPAVSLFVGEAARSSWPYEKSPALSF